MNFLIGLVFGLFLAVGAAYVHDASLPAGPDATARAIVNWEAFDADMQALRANVAEGWSSLTGQKPAPRDERTEREETGV